MNEREIINAWIDFGKALANLEAIENIIENKKYEMRYVPETGRCLGKGEK